ncbi:indole-3-glycerol phosphate synthase TrpC [Dubosiella muris]|uniref:Indole-3-glycerol phosphate synthase TrpC n=1 Tax=Dubosiella muris TaxID=3038133 RepID=A0AC61R7M0_9FIRM|nr:indole-3-glycerol phosphate synthase TrpC [Dubosiella muris]TGY66135.1 indole-3-glycerol phosphate synthase TrpC [Dubosiella muris]
MADLLQTIAQSTRERIAREKERVPLEQLKARPIPAHPSLYEALKAEPLAFLCEVKKASPSKGVIAPVFDPVRIAKAYEEAGASAISCLTEPAYFQGSDAALEAICQAVDVPVLRKDFVVDEYMIVQAAVMGAAGVLLIVELLTPDELRRAIALANQLGMDPLVEVRTEAQLHMALQCGARLLGVNNRDLRDFHVDLSRAPRLRTLVKNEDIVFVAESGYRTREQIEMLEKAGVDAVLIGETLMRAPDKRAMLTALKGETRCG